MEKSAFEQMGGTLDAHIITKSRWETKSPPAFCWMRIRVMANCNFTARNFSYSIINSNRPAAPYAASYWPITTTTRPSWSK